VFGGGGYYGQGAGWFGNYGQYYGGGGFVLFLIVLYLLFR
jgi:hypothetical protein